MINLAYKPTKPKARRNATATHAQCSTKRGVLKERIRALDTTVNELEGKLHLNELRVDILNDVLKTIVETMGLEGVLDPFGAGLSPTKDERKQD